MQFPSKMRQWISHNPIKIFAVSLAALALVVFTAVSLNPSADQSAIQKVCYQALLADQTLAVPVSASTKSQLTISSNAVKTTDTAAISDAVESQMDALVVTTYQKYYTGTLLQQKIQTLQNFIHQHKIGNTRYLGGGIDSMTFSSISVNGSSATVKASAVVWDTVAQVQSGGKVVPATPRGTILLTYTLTKQNSQWFITAEQWNFAPGEAP